MRAMDRRTSDSYSIQIRNKIQKLRIERKKLLHNDRNIITTKSSDIDDRTKKLFKCKFCSNHYSNKGNVTTHMRKTHEEYIKLLKYSCETCNGSYNSKKCLDNHVKTCGRKFMCHLCSKQFNTNHELKLHLDAHNTEVRPTCERCGKSFKARHYLQRHIQNYSNKNIDCATEMHFECNFCSKIYMKLESLATHIRRTHKENNKLLKYSCETCNKPYHFKKYLDKHLKNCGKMFICEVCSKPFKMKVYLERHLETHSTKRPHNCDKCGKSFKTKWYLCQHRNKHSFKKKQFRCEACQKSFSWKQDLRVHLSKHSKFRFLCSLCLKPFEEETNATTHIRQYCPLAIVKINCGKTLQYNKRKKELVGERKEDEERSQSQAVQDKNHEVDTIENEQDKCIKKRQLKRNRDENEKGNKKRKKSKSEGYTLEEVEVNGKAKRGRQRNKGNVIDQQEMEKVGIHNMEKEEKELVDERKEDEERSRSVAVQNNNHEADTIENEQDKLIKKRQLKRNRDENEKGNEMGKISKYKGYRMEDVEVNGKAKRGKQRNEDNVIDQQEMEKGGQQDKEKEVDEDKTNDINKIIDTNRDCHDHNLEYGINDEFSKESKSETDVTGDGRWDPCIEQFNEEMKDINKEGWEKHNVELRELVIKCEPVHYQGGIGSEIKKLKEEHDKHLSALDQKRKESDLLEQNEQTLHICTQTDAEDDLKCFVAVGELHASIQTSADDDLKDALQIEKLDTGTQTEMCCEIHESNCVKNQKSTLRRLEGWKIWKCWDS